MKRVPLGLIGALAVYALVRVFVLHLAFDQVAVTNYELSPAGSLGKALALGVEMPWGVFSGDAPGQLATGVAAYGLYAGLGDSWPALKFVPALWGVVMILALWAFVNRHVSRRAANFLAWLCAIGPSELLLKYSLIAAGNHFENLALLSLTTWAFFRAHTGERMRAGFLVITGLACGFAVFLFLGAALWVLLLAVMHVALRGWREAARDLRFLGPAFALGLAPLVLLRLSAATRTGEFLRANFGGSSNPGRDWGLVFERMEQFLTRDLWQSGFQHSYGSERFFASGILLPSLLLLSAFLVAWLAFLPAGVRACVKIAGSLAGNDRPQAGELLTFPFFALPILLAFAFGVSNFEIDTHWPERLRIAGYRYFLPVFVCGSVLVVILADRLLDVGGKAKVGGVALLLASFASAAWNGAWLREGTPGVGHSYEGWNFVQTARGLFQPSAGLDHRDRLAACNSLPAPFRAHMYRGMGVTEMQLWIARTAKEKGLDEHEFLREHPLPVRELLEPYPLAARPEVARGMGTGLRYFIGLRGQNERNSKLVADVLERLSIEAPEVDHFLVEGAAYPKDFLDPYAETERTLAKSMQLYEFLPGELRPAYGRGLGELCGVLFDRRLPPEEEFLTEFGRTVGHRLNEFEAAQVYFLGVGRGMAWANEDPQLSPACLKSAAGDLGRQAILEGFEIGQRRMAELIEGTEP